MATEERNTQNTVISDGGYCLFLNTGNVRPDGFDFSNCQFISEEKDQRLRKGKLARHDLVMTTRGTIGNVAYYDDNVPYENLRVNSGMVIFRVDASRLHPKFLYHFLRSPDFIGQTVSMRSGVAQPQFPIRDIRRVELPTPDLAIQRKIVSVLSAYDDLIENNRRRMTLLEEAGRLLYQEWFVRLRFPGHEHTHITNGIPDGWMREPLSELTSFLKRGIAPYYDDAAEGLVINQKCIRDGRLISTLRAISRGNSGRSGKSKWAMCSSTQLEKARWAASLKSKHLWRTAPSIHMSQ